MTTPAEAALERAIELAKCIEAPTPAFTCEGRPRKHIKCAAVAAASALNLAEPVDPITT